MAGEFVSYMSIVFDANEMLMYAGRDYLLVYLPAWDGG